MSMTKEEAIKYGENKLTLLGALGYNDYYTPGEYCGYYDEFSFVTVALSALRPVTREQVEKVRGEWIDIDGEKVPVDKYGQPFGWAMCSACGEYLTASDEYPCIGHFCPNCGAPMTDKAVDMVMERLEALKDGKDD